MVDIKIPKSGHYHENLTTCVYTSSLLMFKVHNNTNRFIDVHSILLSDYSGVFAEREQFEVPFSRDGVAAFMAPWRKIHAVILYRDRADMRYKGYAFNVNNAGKPCGVTTYDIVIEDIEPAFKLGSHEYEVVETTDLTVTAILKISDGTEFVIGNNDESVIENTIKGICAKWAKYNIPHSMADDVECQIPPVPDIRRWFPNPASRVFRNAEQEPVSYWVSTTNASSVVGYVGRDGILSYNYSPSYPYSFRPMLCVNLDVLLTYLNKNKTALIRKNQINAECELERGYPLSIFYLLFR